MPTPTEHKTVQARILEYAQDIGWTFVPQADAEQRRGFGPDEASTERALNPDRTRGLIWHTQGSGKTFTMIKAAELLFRAPRPSLDATLRAACGCANRLCCTGTSDF